MAFPSLIPFIVQKYAMLVPLPFEWFVSAIIPRGSFAEHCGCRGEIIYQVQIRMKTLKMAEFIYSDSMNFEPEFVEVSLYRSWKGFPFYNYSKDNMIPRVAIFQAEYGLGFGTGMGHQYGLSCGSSGTSEPYRRNRSHFLQSGLT